MYIRPICNADADCPGSQLPDPVTMQPMVDQSGRPVLSQAGTCRSWKCTTCKASNTAGAICHVTSACSSDADCPPKQAFDANNIPLFNPDGTPVLTQDGTCPPGFCTGDCNNDGRVTVDEVLAIVNVALGNADALTCFFSDLNHDGVITVDEILTGVNTALNGCAPPATPTPSPPRFVDNGDGTVSDVQTGLMWEKKSDDGSIHDKDDKYGLGTEGTAYTVFLNALNDGNFAGHNDWRLPTIGELGTLLDARAWGYGAGAPYVVPVFNVNCGANGDNAGCTVDGAGSTPICSCTGAQYLSVTRRAASVGGVFVWFPLIFNFDNGSIESDFDFGGGLYAARAVRGAPPGWGIPGL